MSTSTSTPTPFSSLASKPPQPPSLNTTADHNNYNNNPTIQTPSTPSRPSPFRSPSSNNYASALASAQARSALPPGTSPLFPSFPMRPHTDPSVSTANHNNNINTNTTGEAVAVTNGTGAAEGGVENEYGNGNGYGDTGYGDTGFGEARGKVVGRGELGEGFRPGIDRMQSWSEQDMKRAMQERLLSPRGEGEVRDMGFSSRQGGGADD
ncbi:hypothetical protein MMC27_000860 [Xylographa pallens]|nr:hypothetical protein [Xylographa pallens]